MAFREELNANLIALQNHTVASLPVTGTLGTIAFCTDGNAGSPGLVYFTGTQWNVVMTDVKAALV